MVIVVCMSHVEVFIFTVGIFYLYINGALCVCLVYILILYPAVMERISRIVQHYFLVMSLVFYLNASLFLCLLNIMLRCGKFSMKVSFWSPFEKLWSPRVTF